MDAPRMSAVAHLLDVDARPFSAVGAQACSASLGR